MELETFDFEYANGTVTRTCAPNPQIHKYLSHTDRQTDRLTERHLTKKSFGISVL